MIPDWGGMLLVLAALTGLMTGIHILQQHHAIHPELSRKLVHIGMGLTTLTFPWLFHHPAPVVLLAILAAAMLVAVKQVSFLKSRLGGVLGAVQRASIGDVCFPAAVGILFVVSKGNPLLFGIPIMILTFGDATAALIGVRYGISRYSGADGMKSFEGSVALFAVAFLSVHVPLLLCTNIGRAQCLLIGLTIGLLAMLLEAIAWNGLDNLFLPLGCYLLLVNFLKLTDGALAARFGVILALVVFVILWRRHTTLNDSALLCAALSGYAFWAIGGLQWLLAPLLLFITYPLLSPRTEETLRRMASIKSVLSVVSVGFVWLFIASAQHRPNLIAPFALSFAVQLSLIGIVRNRQSHTPALAAATVASTVLKSFSVICIPYAAIAGITPRSLIHLGLSLVVVSGATSLFYIFNPVLGEKSTDTRLLMQQVGFAAIGSVVGLFV